MNRPREKQQNLNYMHYFLYINVKKVIDQQNYFASDI